MGAFVELVGGYWFGTLRGDGGRRRGLSPGVWTCVGAFAIPLWATWPALALWSLEMPAFECLTIAFAVGWVVLALLEGRGKTKESSGLGRRGASYLPAIACAIGLLGSNAFHILATHSIPAAEANLLSYLWPVEIVAAGALLGLFTLRARQVVGLVLGFVGAVVLMGGDKVTLSGTGVALALLSGMSWAGYCVYRLKRARGSASSDVSAMAAEDVAPSAGEEVSATPVEGASVNAVEETSASDVEGASVNDVEKASASAVGDASGKAMADASGNTVGDASGKAMGEASGDAVEEASANVLARGCALSTVLCGALHFALEATVMPSVGALGAAVAVGVVPLALGNFVWDEGFRRGDGQSLAVLAYATPLCSALLLGALGLASLSWGLLVGGAVIVIAGVLSRH